jgi:SAM-dependent methyltransferase
LYDEYYYNRPGFEDGTSSFHALCRQTIATNGDILEIGAGPSNPTSDYLAGLGRLKAVDVSHEVLDNRAVREPKVYDGSRLPFDDACFDACISNYVIEHVQNPLEHFQEVRRVLKPGGVYLFRTPNLYYYVSLASAALPHSAHKALANKLRGLPSDSHEPWPTVYRSNTVRALRRFAASAGLRLDRCLLIEKEPSYGRSSAFLFFPMMWYERLVNSTDVLAGLRANILGVMRRQA